MKFASATVGAVVISAQLPLAAPFAPQRHHHYIYQTASTTTSSLSAGVKPPDPSSSSDWLISSLLSAAAANTPPPGTAETAMSAASTATTTTSIVTTLLQTAPLLLAPVAALVAGQQAYQAMQERNALQDELQEQEADTRVQEENLRLQQENIKNQQETMKQMQQSIETTEQAMANSFGAAALSSAISLSVLLGATVPDVATLSSGPAGGAPPTSANNVGGTATTTTKRVVPSATSSSASSVTESRPSSSILMGARAKQEERRAAQDAAQAKRDAKRTEIEANMREQSKASTVDATTAGSSSGMNSLMNKIEDSSAATQTPTSPQEGPATVTEETVSPPTSGTTSAMESLLSQATTTIEEESKELAESEQSIPSAPTTMATTTAPSVTTNDDSVVPPPPKAPPVSFMDTLMSKIDENMASKTQVPPPPETLPSTMEESASKNTFAARIQERMHQQKPETSTAAAQNNIMDTLKEQAVPFAIGAASLSVFAALGAAGDDELDTSKPSEKYEKESFTPYANATASTRFTAAQPKSHFIPNTAKGNQQQPAQSYSPYGASKNWPKKSSPTGLQSSNNGLSPNQPAAKNYSPFGQSTPSSNTGSSNQQFSQPLERNTFSPYGNKDWKKTPSDPKTLFAPSGTWKAPEGEEPKSWPTSTPGDEKSVVEVKTPNGTVQVTLPKGAAPIKGSTPVSGFPSPSTNTFQPISEPVKASAPTPDSTAYGRSMPPPPVQKSSVSSNPKPAAPTSGSYLDRISQAVVLSNNPSDAASTGQMMQPAKPSFGTVSYMEAARPRETSQEDYLPSMDDLEKQRDEYMDLN